MTPSRLNVVVPARAESLSAVRERVADWLSSLGTPDERIGDIVLVVNEACSNSAEHAYRGQPPGPMRVHAAVDDQHIHIQVADSGSWKTPPADPGTRGRGILLMRTLSEQVDLDGTSHGTTVGMRFAVG